MGVESANDATFSSKSSVDLIKMPEPSTYDIIIDCTTMGYIDYMGVDTLGGVSICSPFVLSIDI